MSNRRTVFDLEFNLKNLEGIRRAAADIDRLEQELAAAEEGTLAYEEAQKRLAAAQKAVDAQFKNTQKSASSFTQTLKGAAAQLTAFVGIASGAQILRGAVNTIIDFEQSLANLSAITGATGGDLEFYAEQAREIGRTTTLSASEAVEAFQLIGSASPQLLQNSAALASVTAEAVTLAEAAGITLPEAAATLGNALNAFNLPAEDASRIINTFAAASKEGAREIPFVTQAIEKFGGTAAAAGIGVEESVAAIELLGKTSSDAAGIGTNLRNIIVILRQEAAKQGREFKGLSGELELYGDKLDDVNFLAKTFGRENIQSAANLIANRNELVEFTDAITNTQTAYEQAGTRTATLQGELNKLTNAWNDVVLSFRESTGTFTRVITFLRENLTTILRVVVSVAAGFAAYRATLIATNAVLTIGRAATAAYGVAKVALTQGIRAATIQTRAFNTAIRANPIGLIISGLTTAIALFSDFGDKQQEATENQKAFNDAVAAQNALLGRTQGLERRIRLIPELSLSDLQSLESDIEAQVAQLSDQRVEIQATISGRTGDLQAEIAQLTRELDSIVGQRLDNLGRPVFLDEATTRENLRRADEIQSRIRALNEEVGNVGRATFRQFGTDVEGTTAQLELISPALEQVRKRIAELENQQNTGTKRGTIAELEERVKELRRTLVEDLRIDSDAFQPTVEVYKKAVRELKDANDLINDALEEQPVEGSIDALSRRVSDLQKIINATSGEAAEYDALIQQLIDAQLELNNLQARLKPVDREAIRRAELQEEERHALALLDIARAGEERKLQLQLEYARQRLANLTQNNDEERLEYQKQANAIVELEGQLSAVLSQQATERNSIIQQQQLAQLEGIGQVLQASLASLGTFIGAQQQANQQLVTLQQQRVQQAVAIADQGNAALLQAEEDRLNELNRKREAFVRTQQVLAAAQLVAESSLAIARAAAEGGVAAPFTIAATLIALTAGLAQARATAQAAAAGFKKGGFTGYGASSDEAGVVHKEEFVIDAPTTRMLGLRGKNMVDFKEMFAGRKPMPKPVIVGRQDNALTDKQVAQIVDAILSKPVPTFSFDERGIFTAAERSRKRAEYAKRIAR